MRVSKVGVTWKRNLRLLKPMQSFGISGIVTLKHLPPPTRKMSKQKTVESTAIYSESTVVNKETAQSNARETTPIQTEADLPNALTMNADNTFLDSAVARHTGKTRQFDVIRETAVSVGASFGHRFCPQTRRHRFFEMRRPTRLL
jgi:hypothetical protein